METAAGRKTEHGGDETGPTCHPRPPRGRGPVAGKAQQRTHWVHPGLTAPLSQAPPGKESSFYLTMLHLLAWLSSHPAAALGGARGDTRSPGGREPAWLQLFWRSQKPRSRHRHTHVRAHTCTRNAHPNVHSKHTCTHAHSMHTRTHMCTHVHTLHMHAHMHTCTSTLRTRIFTCMHVL